MMVAWHEMPGKTSSKDPSRRVRYDRVAGLLSCAMSNPGRQGSHRSLRDGSYSRAYQAFHAWLPSFGPSGTRRVDRGGLGAERQVSNSPTLRHAARPNSRTACPTKPKLYSADRSNRPRKRGTLHKQDVGEVGSTRRRTPNTKPRTPNACIP